jgi:hypothetical protein
MTFLVAALRSPQVPPRSLPFPHGKDTQRHAALVPVGPVRESVVTSGGHVHAMPSESRGPLLTTITFVGERQDIIDPDAAVTGTRQTTDP